MESIERILSSLDKLQGLSAVALVFLSCIVMGYIWRALHFKAFPNDAIPIVVILWGAFAMSFISETQAAMPTRVWILRNVIIGGTVGFLAWMLHNYIISKLEDWLVSKLPGLSNTAFFRKTPADGVTTTTPTTKDPP